MQRPIALALVLVAFLLLAFGGVTGLGFLGFDDPVYVTENPAVLETLQNGLSGETASWAFSTFHGSTWLPLTWLSHLLDAATFGTDPAGHHRTSLLLHGLNALLCFHLLRRATGRTLPAFLAAALWAVHPLRVESVAWVSSRKDVLSGLFFLAMLLSWVRYTERPGGLRYALSLLLCAAGLASKQVLVTAPFVLLLLDLWPLGRRGFAESATEPGQPNRTDLHPMRGDRRCSWGRLLIEKLPFLALAIAASVVATRSQQSGIEAKEVALGFAARAANALLAYGAYLRQTFLPHGLAAHYPHPGPNVPMGAAAAAGVLLFLLTGGAAALRRRAPALLVGWLWFAGMLVPMLGLVSFGNSIAHADRFTYLPHMGLAVALVFGAEALLRGPLRIGAAAFGAAFALACTFISDAQVSHWSSDRALWENALAHGSDATIRTNLAEERRRAGDVDGAIEHLEIAVQADPDAGHALKRLGALLAGKGRTREAAPLLARAAELLPDDFEAQVNKGSLLVQLGDQRNALDHLERALELGPDQPGLRQQVATLHDSLASQAATAGKLAEAIQSLRRADTVEPGSARRLKALRQLQLEAGRDKAATRTAERIKALGQTP